jgi:hypothetical protein
MSKHRRKQGGRVTPKGTQPADHRRHRPSREPSLVDDAGRALRQPSPFDLLALASSLIEAMADRPAYRWQGRSKPEMTGPEMFESFVEAGIEETEALALAVATLHPDEILARRLKGRIAERGSVIRHRPSWLDAIDEIEITDVAEMVHILGDGDNIMIGCRWPDGNTATAIIYIDHNMGTIVKDAFVIPENFDTLMGAYRRAGLQDQEIRPIEPAVARAKVDEAIRHGEIVVPPLETDSWPVCRPVIEWILRLLPPGAEGYVRPEWSERKRSELLADFVSSPSAKAAAVPMAMLRDLAEPIIHFGCDYGPGDPLRWSPVSVEIVLADWYPRKVFGMPLDEMSELPDVLDALVRFAHDRQGIPSYLTDETTEAVQRWTPDYLEAIAQPGRSPMANAVRLARVAAGFDPDDFEAGDVDDDLEFDDDDDIEMFENAFSMEATIDHLEEQLIAEVGGLEAFANLTDDPLPDEPFDWSEVPAQWHEATAATLERLDQVTSELCDIETRTIGRRILAALVAGDAGLFNRSADANRLAVAIVYVVAAKLAVQNGLLGFGFRTQKELGAATGVSASAISSRSSTVGGTLRRIGFDWTRSLHSSRRKHLLETKQLLTDWRKDHRDGD